MAFSWLGASEAAPMIAQTGKDVNSLYVTSAAAQEYADELKKLQAAADAGVADKTDKTETAKLQALTPEERTAQVNAVNPTPGSQNLFPGTNGSTGNTELDKMLGIEALVPTTKATTPEDEEPTVGVIPTEPIKTGAITPGVTVPTAQAAQGEYNPFTAEAAPVTDPLDQSKSGAPETGLLAKIKNGIANNFGATNQLGNDLNDSQEIPNIQEAAAKAAVGPTGDVSAADKIALLTRVMANHPGAETWGKSILPNLQAEAETEQATIGKNVSPLNAAKAKLYQQILDTTPGPDQDALIAQYQKLNSTSKTPPVLMDAATQDAYNKATTPQQKAQIQNDWDAAHGVLGAVSNNIALGKTSGGSGNNLATVPPDEAVQLDQVAQDVLAGRLSYKDAQSLLQTRGMQGAKYKLYLSQAILHPKAATDATLTNGNFNIIANGVQQSNANNPKMNQTMVAIDAVRKVLPEAKAAFNALGNGDYPAWNSFANKLGVESGDPKLVAAVVSKQLLADEVTRIMGTGQGGIGMMDLAQQMANTAWNPKQMSAAIGMISKFIDARRDEYVKSMGPGGIAMWGTAKTQTSTTPSVPTIHSKEEFDALPKGSKFFDPTQPGITFTK